MRVGRTGDRVLDEVRLGARTLQPGRQLLAGGERVPIGRRALDILSVLAEAQGAIVTKDELLEAVWPGVVVEENALQVHVVALRKALGPEADRLRTIRGVGYQLAVDPAPSEVPETPGPASPGAIAHETAPEAAPPAPAHGASPPLARWTVWRWPALGPASGLGLALAVLLAVLAGSWAIFGTGPGAGTPDRLPVVVRAFAASGSDEAGEPALASGITDELIVRLRRIPDLRISAANPDGSVPGNGFENAYVVDGALQTEAGRIRVTARLTGSDGEVLWSQSFDQRLEDIFDVQEEIAGAIATALSVSLDVGLESRDYGGTNNPEAYADYFQGRAYRYDADRARTIAYLERAVALDPGYIKAWAELSYTYGISLYSRITKADAEDLLAKMDRASQRALDLNPDLWIGQSARAWYDVATDDLVSADARYDSIAEQDRGNEPDLLFSRVVFAYQMGRVGKMWDLQQRLLLIAPNSPRQLMEAQYSFALGRAEDAARRFDELGVEGPGLTPDQANAIYWSNVLSGRLDDAVRIAEAQNAGPLYRNIRNFHFDPDYMPRLPPDRLAAWADRKFGYGGRRELTYRALFASHFGYQDVALEYLRLAFERPGIGGNHYLWHPALAKLRKTEGFVRFLRERGMIEAWRESGDWGDFCRPLSATEATCT